MALLDWIPEGTLPKWLFFISAVALFNSAQTYVSGLALTRRVYEAKPQEVTGLSARTFGTWTVLASFIRFYGAYNINVAPVYDITLFSFILAGAHFASEWLVFKTAKLGKGLTGPLVVAGLSTVWMISQRDFYLS